MYQQRINEILSQATLQEKCMALAISIGPNSVGLGCFDRLGIRGLSMGDNPRGMQDYYHEDDEARKSDDHTTAYPPGSVIAASWNTTLAERLGDAMAEDALHAGIHGITRPALNIKRSPLGGRHFEYYSEDPVLAGEMAGSYIIGMQKRNVAANVKHFCMNNQEYERMVTNAVVTERALRELYLAAFEIAIKKGNPWTLMTSYNKINGDWSNSNKHILHDILRKEWGYEGVVVSDAMAIHTNIVEAHNCGMDVELSAFTEHMGDLMDAYNSGELSMETIDASLTRILKLYFRLTDAQKKIPAAHEAHHALAVEACQEGLVLLKNEDNILPLCKEKPVAVIGVTAKIPAYMGGGSGHQNARNLTRAYCEIAEIIGESKITYAQGYPDSGYSGDADYKAYDPDMIAEAVDVAMSAETVLLFVGNTFGIESEGYDRDTMDLPYGQQELIRQVCAVNNNIILIVSAGAPVTLTPFVDDCKAVIMNWLGGEGMGKATANVLYGLAEPGGRMTETWPLDIRDTPAFNNFPHYPNPTHTVLYGEGVYVGYRWYESRNWDVLYPFGHGLSYTTFEMSNLVLSADKINANDELTVNVTVKNTGNRRGQQVVQLYVKDVESTIDRPEKELKAFAKVTLDPGEQTVVEMKLNRRAFAFYGEDVQDWVVEDGEFQILVGSSSANIELCTSVKVDSKEKSTRYTRMTPVEWILKDPNFAQAADILPKEMQGKFAYQGGMAGLSIMIPFYRLGMMDALGLFPRLNMYQVDTIIARLNELS